MSADDRGVVRLDSGPAAAAPGRPPQPTSRVTGVAWLSSMPLVVNAASLLASLIVIPGLGEAGWGTWTTALGLSGAVGFLTGMGIRPLFVRTLARTVDLATRRRLVSNQLALRLVAATAAGLVALLIGVALSYDTTILACTAIAAVGLLPTVMWTTYTDVLNAEEAFRASAVASLVSGLALTTATVLAVLLGLGPIGVACAYLIGPTLTALQLARQVGRRGLSALPSWDPDEVRRQAREAKLTAAGDGLASVFARLHGVYIPAIIGPIAYGFYVTGTLLVSRLQVIGDAIVTAYTPGLSRDHASLRLGTPTWSSRTLLRLLLTAGVVLGVAALAVSVWFIGVIYRNPGSAEARASALTAMVIVSASLPLTIVAMGWRQLLIAADHHDLAAQTAVKSAGLGALLSVALTWWVGVSGAAAGLVATAAIAAGLLGVVAHRVLGEVGKVPGWWRGAIAYALGALVAGLAASRGATFAGGMLTIASPVATVGLLFGLGVLSWEDLRLAPGLRRIGRE